MTNTDTKIELVLTKDGKRTVLGSNTKEGHSWALHLAPLDGHDWPTLRAASYLCLKAAMGKLPLDSDFAPGVAAAAAYGAAREAEGQRSPLAELSQVLKAVPPGLPLVARNDKGPERWGEER